jgi:polyisoprenoid-binding protein YceI
MPEQKPSTLGLPRSEPFGRGPEKPATAAASVVVVKALAAMASAPSADPALKPYQPDPEHAGADHTEHQGVRGHRLLAETEARAEDDAEHERGPARGHVHDGAAGEVDRLDGGVGIQRTAHEAGPGPDHVGEGKIHREHPDRDEDQHSENFMRSAMAPTMRAGVMMAKLSWNIAHMVSLIQ